MFRLYIFLITMFFFTAHAFASEDFYEQCSSWYEIPEFSQYTEHLDQLLNVGTIELEGEDTPITVKLSIKKNKKLWWNLYFFHPNRKSKKGRQFAVLHFFVEDGVASFKGMLIDEEHRAGGLSKVLFKFFVAFVSHHQQRIVSEKIYKPMFAKLLQDLAMQATNHDSIVAICKPQCREDKTVYIYPYGFDFRQALLKSQNMQVVVREPADELCWKVPVYTSFFVPEDNGTFLEKIEGIPGRISIFIRSVKSHQI